jgi:DNA-binding CsgD family transcriptional regulator
MITRFERHLNIIISLVVIGFFIHDIYGDYLEGEAVTSHFYAELGIVALLIALVVYQLEKIFSTANRLNAANKTIKSLQGEIAIVIDQQLDGWKLTPSEKEVAWLMIKGFAFKEIATFRSVTEKTVHQQAAVVYKKSGVSGRHELISGFLEDFVSNDA